MFKHLIDILIDYGPLGLFVIGLLDSVGLPLPAAMDALLLAYSIEHPGSAYLAAAVAVLGSLIGNLVLFRAARLGGRRFVDRNTPEEEQNRFRRWFTRYGLLTIFVPAVVPFVPLPLKVFVVSAGAMHTPMGKFLLSILAARVIRYFGEAYLGTLLGRNAEGFLRHHAWSIVGVAAAVILGLVLVMRWFEHRQASAE